MSIRPEPSAEHSSTDVATAPAPPSSSDVPSARSAPRSPAAGRERPSLFRAFWRWHFYATVLVVPVLLVLAVTGGIYLLRFQVEPALHADVMQVQQPAGRTLAQPYEAQRRAVVDAYPDHAVVSMSEPRDTGRSTVFSTEAPDGSPLDVFVDPWTADVLGALDPDTTLSGTAVRLHAELMAGTTGDVVIELAACWAVVMALTGYYLWCKGRGARRRARLARARGAVLRQRHATVGAIAGTGLLFLLVSGLPWTGFWGEKAQAIATSSGTSFWSEDHGALSAPTTTLDESLPHSHAEIPWAQGDLEVPTSSGEEGAVVANVDTAIAVADAEGLRHPMTVALPAGDDGVLSVLGFAFDDPTDERTVHVDQYDGEVVATYGYADYPGLAKVVAHGIALHEGRHFGTLNLLTSLAFCAGIVFLCISGPWVWWRRRPRGAGSLGAPRGRMPLRSSPALAIGVLALALLLPLFGLSLAVVLLLDQLLLRRVGALRHWFAVT